jgi:hypothetical protein
VRGGRVLEREVRSGVILCRHCGSQVYANQNFCLECGQSVAPAAQPTLQMVSPQTQATRQAQAQSSRTKLIVLGLVATAAVSVAVTVLALRGWNGGQARESGPAANSPPPSNNPVTTTPRNVPTPSPPAPTPTPLGITAKASSTRVPMGSNTYNASNVLDRDLQTAWVEGGDGPGIGEWIQCDFDREVTLRRIHITPGYFKSERVWLINNRLSAATFFFSDGSSRQFNFPDVMQEQTLDVGRVRTRSVRVRIDDIYAATRDVDDTAISQLTFDWER